MCADDGDRLMDRFLLVTVDTTLMPAAVRCVFLIYIHNNGFIMTESKPKTGQSEI